MPFLAQAAFGFLFLFALLGPAHAQRASDAAMIAGFNSVVFSSEITGPLSDGTYLKKFTSPVRFRIEHTSRIDRRAAVRRFVAQVDAAVDGLETTFVDEGQRADFIVHIVDRARYQEVGRRVYGNPFMAVPGNCIVRANYSRQGLRRSDAIIVSDEGEPMFRRCMVEEILQGLGPLNDNADAPESVFNDTSQLTEFTRYDRLILNMLYDERLVPGMREADAAPLLPAILRDARRRLARR
jgi:hypothetical protein